jgi:hypothetical protein
VIWMLMLRRDGVWGIGVGRNLVDGVFFCVFLDEWVASGLEFWHFF